jgi:hypothetical protein
VSSRKLIRVGALGFLFAAFVMTVAYAATQNQIWNAVFDSSAGALRVVAP